MPKLSSHDFTFGKWKILRSKNANSLGEYSYDVYYENSLCWRFVLLSPVIFDRMDEWEIMVRVYGKDSLIKVSKVHRLTEFPLHEWFSL